MITLFKDHKNKSKFQTKANFVRGLGYIEYNVQKVQNLSKSTYLPTKFRIDSINYSFCQRKMATFRAIKIFCACIYAWIYLMLILTKMHTK